MRTVEGRVIRAVGGLFGVLTSEGESFDCRARGVLKLDGPVLPGDSVTVMLPDGAAEGRGAAAGASILGVAERKNVFIRPPMANIDTLFAVCSAARPGTSLLTLDKLLAAAEYRDAAAVIVVTKSDLSEDSADRLEDIYRRSGYPVFRTGFGSDGAAGESCGVTELGRFIAETLPGKTAAFAGASGAGKSTLLNRLFPGLGLDAGEVSRKTGRGRHTTRKVELYPAPGIPGAFIADTPGFSMIDFTNFDFIPAEALPDCMPDFADCYPDCRWPDCTHTGEADCGVAKAVREGRIAPSRHESYREMYRLLKEKRKWE